MSKTKIEWADYVFNPWIGCAKISPGCDNCYAERMDRRLFGGGHWWYNAVPRYQSDKYWSRPIKWNENAWNNRTRYRVFCGSMCDVFDNASVDTQAKLWNLIMVTPALDWLLLTKRIGNAAKMLPGLWLNRPLQNVWLGATVVNQEEADRDVRKLLQTPAAIRFLSIEPMLGPIDLIPWLYTERLNWVIVGGESGPKARPMYQEWVQSVRDQCVSAEVPFFFKQWGGTHKVLEGRELDGRTWDEFPTI